MLNTEFSSNFDTLLNSYATQAPYGDQTSRAELSLDEYEKSVFLTMAQDIIVKSLFDKKKNSTADGFDDNAERQIDFSSLITTATLSKSSDQSSVFDDRGILYTLPFRAVEGSNTFDDTFDFTFNGNGQYTTDSDVLFILNEKLVVQSGNTVKNYVVVPINYKEYDRQMSKAYSQPLKKQVWRLFQNDQTGFDMRSELVPKWNLVSSNTTLLYKIRYVRRPYPIVLVNLPNDLNIDGFTHERGCELHPILHQEILQKAVELAFAYRAGGSSNKTSEQ